MHADVTITSNDYETRRRTLSVVEVVGMPPIQREVGRLKMCHGWKRGPEHERASVCLTDLGARGVGAASDGISDGQGHVPPGPHDGGGRARGATKVEGEVGRLNVHRGWAGRGVVTMVGLVAVAAGERAGTNERPAEGPASPAKASHR